VLEGLNYICNSTADTNKSLYLEYFESIQELIVRSKQKNLLNKEQVSNKIHL
jgi:hypothetical protein